MLQSTTHFFSIYKAWTQCFPASTETACKASIISIPDHLRVICVSYSSSFCPATLSPFLESLQSSCSPWCFKLSQVLVWLCFLLLDTFWFFKFTDACLVSSHFSYSIFLMIFFFLFSIFFLFEILLIEIIQIWIFFF